MKISLVSKHLYARYVTYLSHIIINQNLLYYNIIRPMLLYGRVTWIMNKYEGRKLVLFENKILRKISGLTNERGE